MIIPALTGSKRATNDVTVELSRDQVPPTLPFELRDHVSHSTWQVRVSTLTRLASRYCQPSIERIFLLVILVLTFLIPITTYYVAFESLESTTKDGVDKDLWLARLCSFAATIVTWVILIGPWVAWKFLGKLRVKKLADQWTREDALAASSQGASPVWTATAPGLFRDIIVLMVTVPVTQKSYFDRDGCLPPYVSASEDALPPYGDTRMLNWSKDARGGIKYGDIPIYIEEDKLNRV